MGKKRGAGITRTRYAAFRGADFSTDPSLVESCRSPLCTNIVADGGGMPQKADSSKPSCPGLKADKQNQDEKE